MKIRSFILWLIIIVTAGSLANIFSDEAQGIIPWAVNLFSQLLPTLIVLAIITMILIAYEKKWFSTSSAKKGRGKDQQLLEGGEMLKTTTDLVGNSEIENKTKQIVIGMFIILAITYLFEPITFSEDQTFSWTKLWLWACFSYTVFSYRWHTFFDKKSGPVKQEEIGIRLCFERYIDSVGPGVVWAPLFFTTLMKLPTKIQQKEFPGEPIDIDRTDTKDGYIIPEDKVAPFRVTFNKHLEKDDVISALGEKEYIVKIEKGEVPFSAGEHADGLSDRITAEVTSFVRWNIKKENGREFISNIVSIKEANRQIEDEISSVLTRILSKISVGQALQNFAWINAILLEAVKQRTKSWGITIDEVVVKSIPLNHTLNEAITSVATAQFESKNIEMLKVAAGKGDSTAARLIAEAELTGKALGIEQLASKLGISGEEAYNKLIAITLAESDNTIVLGTDGVTQALGGLAAMYKKSQSNKPGVLQATKDEGEDNV